MILKTLRKATVVDIGCATEDYYGGQVGGSTGQLEGSRVQARSRRRGAQHQLWVGKSRGAKATQRCCTAADDNGGGHTDFQDHVSVSVSIVEGEGSTNKPRRGGILRVAMLARRNRIETISGCAAVRTASNDDGGGRAGHWDGAGC